MAYLGRALSNGNYLKLDDISSQFNGSTDTFNLTSGGQAFYPGSTYSILVIITGTVQEADTDYRVLNNQIIFTTPPGGSDTFYCLVLGTALGVGVPANGTITGDKFAKPFSYDEGLLYLDDITNRVGINTTAPDVALDVIGDVSVSGIVTASGGFNLGISSAGTTVTSGPVKTLNFVGTGNTFAVDGTTVDISISSGSAAVMIIPTRSGTAVTFSIAAGGDLEVIARSGTVNVPV